MTHEQVLNDLKAGKFKNVYLLHGDEPYFIDTLVSWMEHHLLSEDAQAFNQTVVYGKDVDYRAIIDEARQFPLMSDRRVIIVREAQEMKTLKDLADYAKKPVPHTILVLVHKHKSFDKRLALAKALSDQVVFESKKLYDNQLPAWILGYAKSIQLGIDDKMAQILADYLGNDLSKIANELDKLALSQGRGVKISLEVIQDQIGISKEFNVFELQKALGEKNKAKAFLIAKYFADNPKENPIQVTVLNLFNYFQKAMVAAQYQAEGDMVLQKKLGLTTSFFVKDYRVVARNFSLKKIREILVNIRMADVESKGVNNRSKNDGQLLTELVYGILN
ncbi:MAG: DNA polymerase III subunit delta [Saprospiraceae bacterium]|nr:DNA polymerase III subunit delta [Saprospiraceae bacterium]